MNNLPTYILVQRGNELDDKMTRLANRATLTEKEQEALDAMEVYQKQIDIELESRIPWDIILGEVDEIENT